ncbi:germination protein YpeB [Viridibacillus sp. YIM B01967]|uniref:Germination protein YpeB n=1 Tax=Viridibacillus soli TaxID=2798301 RepID=A0ABS1HD02_9BACL|nr:PepSY1/2 domain-containing protein [Viridibacillus soli]MBK3497265.1 germination protein YpeB [Viridibacillus soli]
MKKLTFFLVYTVIVFSIFSYTTSIEKTNLKQLLHAQYTNKMAGASSQLNELQKAVQQSLLFSDPTALNDSLQDVWRLSSDIRQTIGDLPLDREFTTQWMNYLGRLGNQAKLTMTTEESKANWNKSVTNVASNLSSFSSEWDVATAHLLQEDKHYNKWLDQLSNMDVDSNFTNLSASVKSYTESDFPLTSSESDRQKKKDLQALKDQPISEKQALARFKEMFTQYDKATIRIEESAKTAPYPFYHITFHDGIRLGYADITKKGGHLLSYLVERPVDESTLSQEELVTRANKRMNQLGFDDLKIVDSRENTMAWHLNYVRINPDNKAKIYADGVQVKIAKDNGEIIGINSMEYIQKETLKNQPMKKINWKTFFDKNVEIVEEDLAYSENDKMEERLCYELTVVYYNKNVPHTFRVLVDTETAEIIKNEKL